MTKFVYANFDMGYGSDRYVQYEGKFVGRFKYSKPAMNARHFVKFLIANFTVEEFFALTDGGMAPATALETKGYICLNVLRAMKTGGFSTVREMLDAQMAGYEQRRLEREALAA